MTPILRVPAALAVVLVLGVLPAGPLLAQSTSVALQPVETDPDEPLEVLSDRLELVREDRQAIFTGNVEATQGALRLLSERLDVFYIDGEDSENGETEVREAIATGDVVIFNGTDVAEGDRAVYTPSDDMLVMTGNVLLTQEDTIISGARLVYDLETGEGTVEGRVRTVFRQSGGNE